LAGELRGAVGVPLNKKPAMGVAGLMKGTTCVPWV